jgi:Family of unknown function (DUF6010)
MIHAAPELHTPDFVIPVIVPIVFMLASSVIPEPNRRRFNAILIAGAGAAYLSGGGLGYWEFAFTAVISYIAYRGLESYRFIGIGWLLHTGWDLAHHFYGNPIIPFAPASSWGCAITDAILAVWFFASAPALLPKRLRSSPSAAAAR